MHKKLDLNWLQLLIGIATILVGVATSYGVNLTRIINLENRLDAQKSDHDILISLSTKMDTVIVDVKELKLDLKKHLEKP